MSSPPLAFVEASFLTAAKSLLADGGVLVTNVAARNEDMKLETLQALQRVFCDLVCIPLQEDINDIVVGTTGCPRSGVDCRNLFCSSNSNGSHTLLVGEDGASPDRMLTGQSAPEKVSTVEEGVRTMAVGSPEGKQMESDSLGPSMWRSSRVGDVSGVRERLRDLVSIVQENGGDVEGLEAQLTGLIMYRTL
ncbi:eEF1A lysine and N-terminal methyltransferase [Geodia barretti]|nr:eEF1A lysine and N-terminal methyltransferase [Geodia barretti]